MPFNAMRKTRRQPLGANVANEGIKPRQGKNAQKTEPDPSIYNETRRLC
jgi:hypothetical protein